MQLNNTPETYGIVTKSFHWLMALLIIGLLAVGLLMEDISELSLKLKVYGLHKSFGIVVLTLAIARIGWHLYSKKPGFVPGLKKIERLAASVVHGFFYIGMVGMPLSGWMMSSAAGRPVSVFGLFTLPDLVPQDQALREVFGTAHEVLGYTLIIGILAHAGAALKHHFVNKDQTLRRMLPF